MFGVIKLNTGRGLPIRPLSVFLVILVTRSCHSSNNGDVTGNGFGDSPAILNPNLNFLDYDLCLANYDVSEGSIIRTKDSQALGGRFINESDLGPKSREECLRLCCRTPHCNVISFEEKNSGSCYLFDCGPIDNFRCKFTEQSHYMSAILRKREDPLNNRHEAELSQLRNPDDNRVNGNGGGPSGQTNNLNVSRIMSATAPPPAALDAIVDNNSRHCSRRQFECKSTRECIAIYNACDGIVQCQDGSDESPELHCPSAVLLLQDSSLVNKGKDPLQLSLSLSQTTSGVDSSLGPSKSSSRVEDFRLAPPAAIIPRQQQGSNGNGGNKDKIGSGNANVNFETSSRMNIFSHKDGGIMDDTYGNQLQQQRQNPAQFYKSYDYGIGEIPNGYGQPLPQMQNPGIFGGGINNPNYGGNGPQYPAPYPGNFQAGYPQQPLPPPYGSGNTFDKINVNVPPLSQQQLQIQQQPPYYYNSNNNNNILRGNQIPQVPDRLLPRTGIPGPINTPAAPGPAIPVTSSPGGAEAPKTVTDKPSEGVTIKPGVPSTNQKLDPAQKVKNLETEREDKLIASLLSKTALAAPKQGVQNVIEAPENIPGAGAVLAFIVGLGMSIIMVIMVGCRLRRGKLGSKRRGKNRLDPDYLVDGMYL